MEPLFTAMGHAAENRLEFKGSKKNRLQPRFELPRARDDALVACVLRECMSLDLSWGGAC